jgi:DNA topoisomerase-1
MDDAFITEIREFLGKTLGNNYLPTKPNQHTSKNSQAEAHEGIRPTHMHSVADIAAIIKKEGLTPDHARIYEMIFKRAVASQMAPARYDSTVMIFTVVGERFKAAGRVLVFDGFLKVYAEVDEEKDKKSDDEKLQLLPPVETGELVPKLKEILEEEKGKLVPLQSGETLIDFLRDKHGWVIDYDLTRKMEGFLDLVVENKETWQRFCKGVHNKMGFSVPPVRAVGGGPSEGQLKYANDLAQKYSLVILDETRKSGKLLFQWIEEVITANKQPAEPSQPVPKTRAVVKKKPK